MTVIAARDGVLAADTQLSPSGHRVSKLVRLPDGSVAGGAGLWAKAWAVLAYLADGGSLDGKGDKTPPDAEGAEILVMRPDGSLWVIEEQFPAYPLLTSFTAIGDGEDFARMGMEMGLSAEQAVVKTIAMKPSCGGPVQTIEIQRPAELSGPATVKARK